MSKIGAVVLESQTYAEDCYNLPKSEVETYVLKQTQNEPKWMQEYILENTLHYWEEIQSDLDTYFG